MPVTSEDHMIHIGIREWAAQGSWYRHRGHEIFYRESGAGEALVLIHGFPTASWDWQAVWGGLVSRFRVIAPDMIGFGFSAKPQDYDYGINDQATLVEGLLAERGVSEVHVLAHDYGDTVAQELLARFIQRQSGAGTGLRLRSVCFLNGGLFPETHRPRPVQRLLISPLGPLLARLMGEPAFRRSFTAVFGPRTQPSPDELHAFWQLVQTNDGLRNFPKLIRYMDERREHRERWVGALQKARIPMRVINGPLDPVSGLHMVERYRQLVASPDVVLLDGIGHYPQVEDPAGVLAAFVDFAGRA
jgi:pimeloyl-ACP methyl ester carboxylesterase